MVSTNTDLAYRVESSGELQTWSAGPEYTGLAATAGPGAVEHAREGSGRSTLIVRDVQATGNAERRFLRLAIDEVE